MQSDRWFSVSEACRILGISRTTLLAAESAAVITPSRTPGGHRRYSAGQLERYLGAGVPLRPDPGPRPAGRAATAVDATFTAVVRDAVRPLARSLDAECAGFYLHDDGRWQLAGTAGVPRWLAERLASSAPPAPVTEALQSGGPRLFDPRVTGFPDARSPGHGVAVRVRAPDRVHGALFLVTRPGRAPLPGELQVVGAVADLLGVLVEQLVQNADLRGRLRDIAALCPDRKPAETVGGPG
ncbi:hypothetical protein Ae168Ps1_5442 [Pseudonocardia sp. Ae168_Ps1]|uniref:helix-turn-helix domain-containing protein n=1 Tax=unclassified Pseudonocardia TaxID=2619320 RepID=UPI0006CB813F|nr:MULTISPECIES: helix-turn-helix domain-containing protein [unclassified Pseudonocardia]ALE73903.1 hypothetical protein FRP1_14210 [Pseudonocardia sp. EC080625-04]OLL70939.1 hypothetical protein Ae168Ps1_5442 [Pseudonocardia sp. Ae168_Ps1]OLL77509.1 hypothetical protein Ae150APs1_5887c [Pseudonocardia sp. Ae150A_Ps1]OLL88377.1 hypothetical protein Ae263Ps1_5432 [Pseudonocardia sp. Ae263_Ps1]OLL91600.1 hypothetical protein Ae356Ps1_1497c [Pseudonocardia sp. Ae356_Ps1]